MIQLREEHILMRMALVLGTKLNSLFKDSHFDRIIMYFLHINSNIENLSSIVAGK
jgi:hypothetical protein